MPAFVLTNYEVNNYTCHGFKMQHIQYPPNFILLYKLPLSIFFQLKNKGCIRTQSEFALQETPKVPSAQNVEILLGERDFRRGARADFVCIGNEKPIRD